MEMGRTTENWVHSYSSYIVYSECAFFFPQRSMLSLVQKNSQMMWVGGGRIENSNFEENIRQDVV